MHQVFTRPGVNRAVLQTVFLVNQSLAHDIKNSILIWQLHDWFKWYVKWGYDKCVDFVRGEGGSVINGATPSSSFPDWYVPSSKSKKDFSYNKTAWRLIFATQNLDTFSFMSIWSKHLDI